MQTTQWQTDVFPLYTSKHIMQWPALEWIIEGVIQPASLVVIFGQSRAGKSFLALDLATKIASGEEWFDYKVNQRKVIYIATEGMRGIQSRVKAIEQTNGKSVANDNLMYMNSNVDLAKAEDIQKIIDTTYDKANVLIVDTFNAATPGADENSSKDMGKIIYGIRQIISECRCTVILIHHTGWDDKDRMRGHSSLSAATDTRIHVKHTGGLRKWAVTGQRDGEVTEWKHFHLDSVTLEDNKTTSCIVVPTQEFPQDFGLGSKPITKNQQLILDLARKLFSERDNSPLTSPILLENATPIIDAPVKHQSTRAKDALSQLIRKGLITVSDEGNVTNVCT